MAFFRLVFCTFSLGLSILSFAKNTSVWIVGEKNISFYSPDQGLKTLEGLSPKSTLVDPETCILWTQSENHLSQILPNLQIQKTISSSDGLLSSEMADGFFITVSREFWTMRDREGNPFHLFPSLAPQPLHLQGNKQIGFWSLQFDKETNHLELLHFDSLGKLIWIKPVSEQVELWSQPKLNLIHHLDQIWISFTASSTTHAYSPMVELWNTSGKRLTKYPFSDRGLLLDTCTTDNQEFLLARDIPSSPYTVPLFAFIEWLSPTIKPKSLYQASDNYLINSIQCRPEGIWTLQKSVLGGQNTLLVELSAEMQEKTVLPLKEPAWKIHACSLQ